MDPSPNVFEHIFVPHVYTKTYKRMDDDKVFIPQYTLPNKIKIKFRIQILIIH